jgi:hypothetical protein
MKTYISAIVIPFIIFLCFNSCIEYEIIFDKKDNLVFEDLKNDNKYKEVAENDN